jgi:hypothetical protein
MREVGSYLRAKMEVQVENRCAPLVCIFTGERREDRGCGDGFEEFTSVHDTPPSNGKTVVQARHYYITAPDRRHSPAAPRTGGPRRRTFAS